MLKRCLSLNIDGDVAESNFQLLLGKLVFLFYFDVTEIERSLTGFRVSRTIFFRVLDHEPPPANLKK